MLRRLRDRQTRLGLKRRSAGAHGGGNGGSLNGYSGVVDDDGGGDSHDDAEYAFGDVNGGALGGDSFEHDENDATNSTRFGNNEDHGGHSHSALQEDSLSQQHSQLTMQQLKQVDPNFENWDDDDDDDDDHDNNDGGYNSHSQLNTSSTTNQSSLLDSIHVQVVPPSTSSNLKQSPHRHRQDRSRYKEKSRQRMQQHQNQRRLQARSSIKPPFQSSALTIHSASNNSLVNSGEFHSLGSTHATETILQEKRYFPSSSSPITRHLTACGMDINNHHPCNSTTITSTTVNSSGESCSLNEYSQLLFSDHSTKLDATMPSFFSSTLASETVGESTLESTTTAHDEHDDYVDDRESATNTNMSEMDVDEIIDAYRNALRDLDGQVEQQEARASAKTNGTTVKVERRNNTREANEKENRSHVIQQTMQSIVRKHEHHYQPTPPQRRSRPGSISNGNNGGSSGDGNRDVSPSRGGISTIPRTKDVGRHQNENENYAAKSSNYSGRGDDLPKNASITKLYTADTTTPTTQTAQSDQYTTNIDSKTPSSLGNTPSLSVENKFVHVRIISNVHGDVTSSSVPSQLSPTPSPSQSTTSIPKEGQKKSHSHALQQKQEPTQQRQSSSTKNLSIELQPTPQTRQPPQTQPELQRAISPIRSTVASTTVASTVRHANGTHLIDRLLRQTSANAKRQQQEKHQQQQQQEQRGNQQQKKQQQERSEKQQQREKRRLKIEQQKRRQSTPSSSAINAKNLSPPTEPDGISISELIASSASPSAPSTSNRNDHCRDRPDPPPDPPSSADGISATRKSNTPKRSRPVLPDPRNMGNSFLRQKQLQHQQGRHNQQNQSEGVKESLKPRHQKEEEPEWTTPIPFKKVQSSQSRKSESTHTFLTANTTTTSRFWDEVEEFPDNNGNDMKTDNRKRNDSYKTRDNNGTPPSENSNGDPLEGIGEEDKEGLHGNPTKFKHAGEKDFVILRKNNERNRELYAFFKSRSAKGASSFSFKGRRPTTTGRSKRELPISPKPDEDIDNVSNSFSLHLNDSFDDEDISALEMGDSATVYHLRATQSESDHWKKKYERLRQEARSLTKVDGSGRSGVYDEDQEGADHVESQPMAIPCSSPLVAFQKLWGDPETMNDNEKVIAEDHLDRTQFMVQQQQGQQHLLLRCGDYGGGKKAKAFAQSKSSSDRTSNRSIIDNGERENVSGTKQETSLPISSTEMGWILRRAREERDASLRKVHGVNHSPEEESPPPTTTTIADDKHHAQQTKPEVMQEDVCEEGIEIGEDEDNSVPQKMDSPSHHSSRMRHNVPNVVTPDGTSGGSLSIDGEVTTYSAQPTYVFDDGGDENDLKLLKQWNRGRNQNQKSLADDLTVGTPRSRRLRRSNSDGSHSELSENAKLIFDAALKHDVKALRQQRSSSLSRSRVSTASQTHKSTSTSQALSHVSSLVESLMSSHFASNIPQDFSSWFELPSPGSCCISLLPLLDESTRSAFVIELLASFDGVTDKLDANSVPRITPFHRVGDVIDRAFNIFLHSQNVEGSENEGYTGPVVADGDDGSIRFANAALYLRGICDVALRHAKNREFQDAIDVYNTLLRSCRTSSGPMLGLVGQLIASTLHNLSVLHIWNKEFDQALPYCRECLRIKTELIGDSIEAVQCWANMGLISYAMESFPSSLTSFRKAAQLSMEAASHVSGIFINNVACVHTDMSKVSLARTEFDKSVQVQKGESLDISFDSVALGRDELLSISISIFNVGVSCAKQKQYETAVSHIDACFSIQSTLMDESEAIVQTTLYYLNLLRSLVPTSRTSSDTLRPDAMGSEMILTDISSQSSSEKPMPVEPKVTVYTSEEESHPNKHFDKRSKSPRLRSSITRVCKAPAASRSEIESEIKYDYPFFTKNNEISYPMISLGSLRNEATSAERVQQSLETCVGNQSLEQGANKIKGSIYTNQVAIGRNQNLRLICTSVKDSKTLPQNIINFGLRRIRRRETQRVLDSVKSELNDNLQRYGPRHPLVGLSHNSLGLVHMYTENYEDAILEFEKSITVNNKALGLKHPDVSATLMFKGLAQLALERYDEAIVSMLRVRRCREDALGNKHKEVGQILNNLACVQYELGHFNKAETLFQEALDIQREIFTTEHSFLKSVSIVLCNIAHVHAKIGSFPKALIELEGALQIRRDILYEDDVEDSGIAENMAHILAIHQLQHGSGNLDDITKEYISMLKENR